MASAIFFNGKRLNVPQAVTKIDTSALSAVSPAAVGVIAFIGTAVGGEPLTVEESESDATRASVAQERYLEGDLRIANSFAFAPSADEAVTAGASKTINVKVNPSTGAGTSLPDGNGADSLDITSKDSGQFTDQINVEIAAGTLGGQKVTVVFEDVVEVFDNVGGEELFDALYTPGTDGYDTMLGSIDATKLVMAAAKAEAGLTTERAADIPAPGVVSAVSLNVADTQTLTVWGLSGGAVVSDTLLLAGTTPVVGTQSFDSVLACRLSAAAAGTVTISDSPVTTTLFTLLAAELTKGVVETTNTPAASVAVVSIDVDTATDVVLVGLNSAGAVVSERFDMTAGATTPVVGLVAFASITEILLGDVAAARTVAVNITAAQTLHATFSTVAKVADRLNTLDGFVANTVVSNSTTFLMVDADYHAAADRPPVSVHTVAGKFFADLFFVAQALTQRSAYVNAAKAAGGGLPPANTAAPVYLSGGSEGVTTITEWQAAFKLLEKRRYNIIVPLSRDPAVHALMQAHLVRKAGALKSEANGYAGIGKADGSGEARTELQSQIQALSYRNICAISQEIERFHPDTGLATFFLPYIYAAIAAGMQAGSAIAEPLTRKTMTSTDLRNDSSWTVEDDASDLIDRGLMMAEKVDGIGIRWVRSVTTHLADDKLVFVEMSSNESLNTFLFEFRNAIEKEIGKRGLGNTTDAILSVASGVAERMVDEEKIINVKNIQVERVGDSFPVSAQVFVIDPVNFIPITVHVAANVST